MKGFLRETAAREKITLPRVQSLLQKPYAKDMQLIALPEPELLQDHYVNFLELVETRTTHRMYKDEPLDLKELSYLLWCTQGVKAVTQQQTTFRTVPSAGMRHALETYLFLKNVTGLKSGLYRFLAVEHALLFIKDVEEKAFAELFFSKRSVALSAVTLLWTARSERMTQLCGKRGYRYLFLDAGHVCQNLYLAAQTLDIGVCPLGAFDDEKLNELLELDEDDEFTVYAAALGKI